MSTNLVFKYTEAKARVVDRGGSVVTAPGTPFIAPSAEPAVAITGSGNYTISSTENGITVSGIPRGGVGLAATEVSTAFDGTWEHPVTGAVSGTTNGTNVYITSGGALTLTLGSNTFYGVVDKPKEYVFKTGLLPVKIGVVR